MTVKLAPALPKDDRNGLAAIATQLADRYYSGERTTAIVVLESIADTRKKGDRIPEVRVVRIEPVDGDRESSALDLLQDASEQRVGRKPDTLNLHDDPAEEFADVTPDALPELEAVVVDAELVEEPAQ